MEKTHSLVENLQANRDRLLNEHSSAITTGDFRGAEKILSSLKEATARLEREKTPAAVKEIEVLTRAIHALSPEALKILTLRAAGGSGTALITTFEGKNFNMVTPAK